jgi:hypothetical protein
MITVTLLQVYLNIMVVRRLSSRIGTREGKYQSVMKRSFKFTANPPLRFSFAEQT